LADDLGWEAIPGEAGVGGGGHPTRLPGGGPLGQAGGRPT
jgi:hypothetical protein